MFLFLLFGPNCIVALLFSYTLTQFPHLSLSLRVSGSGPTSDDGWIRSRVITYPAFFNTEKSYMIFLTKFLISCIHSSIPTFWSLCPCCCCIFIFLSFLASPKKLSWIEIGWRGTQSSNGDAKVPTQKNLCSVHMVRIWCSGGHGVGYWKFHDDMHVHGIKQQKSQTRLKRRNHQRHRRKVLDIKTRWED